MFQRNNRDCRAFQRLSLSPALALALHLSLSLFFCVVPTTFPANYCKQMGSRLGRQKETILFRHNDVMHLDATLANLRDRRTDPSSSPTNANIFVAVESVYSMDGDLAPLTEILRVAGAHGAMVIVDEAHG